MKYQVPHQIPAKALEEGPFNSWELTVKKTFSLKGLYKRLYEFLVDERWTDLNGDNIDNGGNEYETYFFKRTEGDLAFHVIWWRATKRPYISGNNYYQLYLILDMNTKALKDKQIIYRGEKVDMNSGELKINAEFFLVEQDSSKGSMGSQWDTHWLLNFSKKQFWNRTNKRILDGCKGELMKFSNDLYELIQKYTGVMPEGKVKDFSPVKGTHN